MTESSRKSTVWVSGLKMHKASNHDWQKYMKRNVISVHTIDDNGIILFWVFPRSIYVSFKLIERANNFRKIKVAPAKKLSHLLKISVSCISKISIVIIWRDTLLCWRQTDGNLLTKLFVLIVILIMLIIISHKRFLIKTIEVRNYN